MEVFHESPNSTSIVWGGYLRFDLRWQSTVPILTPRAPNLIFLIFRCSMESLPTDQETRNVTVTETGASWHPRDHERTEQTPPGPWSSMSSCGGQEFQVPFFHDQFVLFMVFGDLRFRNFHWKEKHRRSTMWNRSTR